VPAGRDNRYGGQPYARPDRAQREREREKRDREMRDAQSKKAGGGGPVGGLSGLGAGIGGGLGLSVAGGPDAELAVMGRAVKSYKDLDATEGRRAVDELDY